MPPDAHLSRLQAAAVAGALVVSLAAVGVLDAVTGSTPDMTVLYLLPLLAATYYFGLRTGLTAALGAMLAQTSAGLWADIPVERGVLDGFVHGLVFAAVVAGTDRLLSELREVRRLEALRDLELATARRVHTDVVGQLCTRRADVDLAARLRFIREIGGDYYWFEDLAPDTSFLCVADISGKGVGAALFTALLDQSVRDAVRRSQDLREIVRLVNRRIADVIPRDMFITFFAAVVAEGRLSWLNAGHEPGLLWRRRTGSIETLQTDGCVPLGVTDDFRGEAGSVLLEHGDVLLALTDGVTESPWLRDAGREPLRDALHVAAAAGHNAEGIVDAVCAEALPDESIATDDVAIVCVRYLGAAAEAQPA